MSNDQNSTPEEASGQTVLRFDPGEISAAATLENAEMQQATINYLNNRVTVLRALVTRLSRDNEALRNALGDQEVPDDDGVEVDGIVQGDREDSAESA